MIVRAKASISTSGKVGSRHKINLVNKKEVVDFSSGKKSEVLGNASLGGKGINLSTSLLKNNKALPRTSAHEFGHSAGLKHKNAAGQHNIMTQSGKSKSTTVTSGQVKAIKSNYESGKLNQNKEPAWK